MTIKEKVERLASLRVQRKAIVAEEKPLKDDVKKYMNQNSLETLQADQARAVLKAQVRTSLDKAAIAKALGMSEKALVVRFGKVTSYDAIIVTTPKLKVGKVKR